MNLNDLSARDLARLDSICLDFETSLRAGNKVSIEEIVQQQGGSHADLLRRELTAIKAEIDESAVAGQLVPPFAGNQTDTAGRSGSDDVITQAIEDPTSRGEGDTIGPYQITGRLGHGGMGVVYDAIDTRLGRKVAIKMLNLVGTRRQELMDRFEHEAKAVAALTHPNIVELFDVGTAGDVPYAVMEFLDGETLADRLDRTQLSPAAVRALGGEIADALAFAHENGVIHRDLKPQNIMLVGSKSGSISGEAPIKGTRVKLFDFGLSRVPREAGYDDAEKTKAGMILGTPGYMAPEQARGEPATLAADVFSLGCVLYEAFYGHKAIPGSTMADRLAATLGAPPEPDPIRRRDDVPLAELIDSCLAKDPSDRPSAAEAATLLRQSTGDLAVASHSFAAGEVGRRMFLMSVSGGLCGAVAGALLAQNQTDALTDIRSIAVLSIKDLSASEQDQGMPGDGQPLGTRKMDRGQQIAVLLVNELARLHDFAVPPFRPLEAELPDQFRRLGEELGVDAFLKGTVQTTTTGDKKHTELSLQIVSASSGKQLWGDTFVTEASENLLEQGRFAGDIATTIGRRLTTAADKTGPARRKPYCCTMDGKARSDPDSIEGLKRALTCFKDAIKIDPRFADPAAGLALTSITLAAQSDKQETLEYIQLARAESERALQLDNTSIDARLAQAMLRWQTLLHYDEAAMALRELAAAAGNNWQVQYQYGLLLLTLGDHAGAMRALRDASRLNPHSIMVKIDRARAEWISGRVERAISDAIRYRDRYDHHKLARGLLVDIYEQQQQWNEAANEQDGFDRGVPLTNESYFRQRKQKLADLPYGPFGDLMNRSILDCRLGTIDDTALAELSESQSPMFPLLLAVHPAFGSTRLLPRAKENLPASLA